MNTFSVFLIAALSIGAQAEMNLSQSDLKKMALKEAETARTPKTAASEVQVSGTLVLEDPTPQENKRNYDWVFGVKVQSFQPTGRLKSEDTAGVELGDIRSFYLPSLEGGFRRLLTASEKGGWHWGTLLHAGYATQESQVTFYSQRSDTEAKLATLLTDVDFFADFEPYDSKWGGTAGIGFGSINYAYTGSTSYSNFSERANFYVSHIGGHLNFPPNWQISLSYLNRNLFEVDRSIAIPTDSLELGTRYIW